MVAQEAVDAARAVAIMVRVHGPDPKGRKMRRHAFYHSVSGDTTLSASGLLLSNHSLDHSKCGVGRVSGATSIVITCASIVEPFLLNQSSSTKLLGTPKLIPGAEVDILVEISGNEKDGDVQNICHLPHWLPAKLVSLVDIPLAAAALQALLDAHGGSADGPWEVGWSLAPTESAPQLRGLNTQTCTMQQLSRVSEYLQNAQSLPMNESSDKGSLALATTRVAVLSLCSEKIVPDLVLAEQRRRGDIILAIGSPFGALSPLHFFNSISVGIVANCWPPSSSQLSLLMADVRCLPGMEGAPIFSEHGSFVGILARPLRQRGGGAEVQLVITWNALAPALHDLGVSLQGKTQQEGSSSGDSNCVEKGKMNVMGVCGEQLQFAAINHAVSSVVLVTVGDGAWASGIILNERGLILTNAHLLEPWRFGKAQPSRSERELSVLENEKDADIQRLIDNDLNNLRFQLTSEYFFCNDKQQDLGSQKELSSKDEIFRTAMNSSIVAWPALETNYKSYRRIRVRLDHMQPHSWYDAKAVYVSKGLLDVALLLLDVVPPRLTPIIPEECCPLPGSMALVIGHGLFGPRSDLGPSISAGVVARVVKTMKYLHEPDTEIVETPAMLETTAAVHPGGSGGAVVNGCGHMIGLVTSNARHSGGTVIPHLNFSIPFAALKPIFSFATGDMNDLTILSSIDKPNEQLSAVWALVPPTPPRSAPQLPILPQTPVVDNFPDGNESKDLPVKGSRFAKFISENGMQLSLKQPRSIQEAERQVPRKWTLVKETKNNSITTHIYHSRL